MSATRIIYYINLKGENPVREFTDSLEKLQKAKIFRILQTIEIYGLSGVVRHVKKIRGTPLWEIRVIGKNNIRILYAVATNSLVLLLHGFVKKSQKTPIKELAIAISRYNKWKESERNRY